MVLLLLLVVVLPREVPAVDSKEEILGSITAAADVDEGGGGLARPAPAPSASALLST